MHWITHEKALSEGTWLELRSMTHDVEKTCFATSFTTSCRSCCWLLQPTVLLWALLQATTDFCGSRGGGWWEQLNPSGTWQLNGCRCLDIPKVSVETCWNCWSWNALQHDKKELSLWIILNLDSRRKVVDIIWSTHFWCQAFIGFVSNKDTNDSGGGW